MLQARCGALHASPSAPSARASLPPTTRPSLRALRAAASSPKQPTSPPQPLQQQQRAPSPQQQREVASPAAKVHSQPRGVSLALSAALAGAGVFAAGPAEAASVLDASTAHLLQDVLRPTFALFTALYIVRIPMTWYPNIDGKSFPWNIAVAPTEPVLEPTRKVVGLVGGVDISPIIWVALISFFNEILLGPQGLLILVERQGGV